MRSHRPLALTAVAAASVALAAVPLATATPAGAGQGRAPYTIDSSGPAADAVFPEGVATDGTYFYVGSTTDGTVYRGALGGTTATPFLPGGQDGRTSAIGMKVADGYLFVAGGGTGRFFVYDVDTGELVGSYAVPSTGAPTFVNDVAVAPDGTVYVTDSLRPVLYAVSPDYATDGVETLQVGYDYAGTELVYRDGFNVNGIVASPDGRYLLLAQSNTGTLFRVDRATGEITAVDLGGAKVSGDGLVLRGRTLYAVERAPLDPSQTGPDNVDGRIVEIRLAGDWASGTLLGYTRDETFDDPTTAAFARGRLLVVNSQFGERTAGVTPSTPFTVSSIPVP
jgi:Cu-Zn family superoxide dismutase